MSKRNLKSKCAQERLTEDNFRWEDQGPGIWRQCRGEGSLDHVGTEGEAKRPAALNREEQNLGGSVNVGALQLALQGRCKSLCEALSPTRPLWKQNVSSKKAGLAWLSFLFFFFFVIAVCLFVCFNCYTASA